MNRFRVLFSLTLLLAAVSLASAGSFGTRACANADGAVCGVDASRCPMGPEGCPPCPMPCAPDDGAAATIAAR